MRFIHILSYVAQIALFSASYSSVFAKTPTDTANTDEELTCRQIIKEGAREEQVYCGTEEQWAEFDRRVELINAGVTCRWARTPRELCMNTEQWKVYDRQALRWRHQGRFDNGAAESGSAATASRAYNSLADPYNYFAR